MLPRPPAAPHTRHHVVRFYDVRRPTHQHAIRGGRAQQITTRLLPGQMLGLGLTLMRLHAGELAVAAVVSLVAPDTHARREHRILAGEHPRIVGLPPAAMHHHFGADLDIGDLGPYRPDDSRAVTAAGVKVFRLTLLLTVCDHVDGISEGRPHVVVVDAGRHHVDEHVLRSDFRGRDHLALPGLGRLAEPVLAHQERVHVGGHLAERWAVAEIAEVDACHGQFLQAR